MNFQKIKISFIFSILIIVFLVSFSLVKATNCPATDYDCQIAEIQREIDALTPAQENNKKELASLNAQLTDLKRRIATLSGQLDDVASQIAKREEELAYVREIFNKKIGSHYMSIRTSDPIILFLLSSSSVTDTFHEFIFRKIAADKDREAIEKYVTDLNNLKKDKESLEKNKANLGAVQTKVDARAKFLGSEVAKVDSYLSQLSAKQQEILAAKNGSFIASVGDSELADDYNASIKGFREAAPSGSFAVFSFGAYTHRKGMSQYGARGRAQNNQDYKTILRAYFGKEPVNKDTGGTINVAGYGAMDFESTYLWGIAEMPSTWNSEALKAQAVAARTYAYRFKQNGTTICTTEDCQVFSKSKSDSPPTSWKQAVIDTRGQVLEDVVTFYSSTTGGYLTTMGWDTTDGGGGQNFFDKSYEKIGGSPWAYKAWYAKGYSPDGDKCGKSNPWLNATEFADIVNAVIILKNTDDSRVTPVTTSCWGGNPYSYDELRNVAKQYGGIDSISSIYATQGEGTTNQVVVNGNIYLSGAEFKKGFNLRAPGYLRIPQNGFSFFNIEKK